MENWKIGNHPSEIISDTKQRNRNFPIPPNREESTDEEIKHYGGYLVCESVGNPDTAKLIAAAPDLLNAAIRVLNNELNSNIKLQAAVYKATK